MIKPLVLGNRTFSNNIIQGPLAGVSCAPFRVLTSKYSQPAFSCTEMISSKALLYQDTMSHIRYVKKDPQEGPLCYQLSGNNSQELAEAVKRVTDYGADLIDLNCGCPVKKIRTKGSGSSLLTNVVLLAQLLNAMRQNTSVPISLKIRVDGVSGDKANSEIVKVVNESGVDFIIVHGRHWTDGYDIPCHYDEIKFFIQQVKVPVIGNGDIACLASLKKMFQTGCAGVMVSRAGVGQPWLIGKLQAQMKQESFVIPSSMEIGEIFIEHMTALTELLGSEKFAILHGRKLAKYYARNLPHKTKFCLAINTCDNLSDFILLVRRYFINQPWI